MSNRYHNNKTLINDAFIYICGLLFVALLAVYFIRDFSNEVESKRVAREYSKMSEIADMYASNIEDEINVLVSFVRATASQISEVGGPRSQRALELIRSTPNKKDIVGMAIVFPNKTFVTALNIDIPQPAMSVQFSSKTVVLHRSIANKEYMAIIVPIYENGVVTANLRALILGNRAKYIIDQKIFKGMGNSILINRNGQCLLCTHTDDTTLSCYNDNLFEMLKHASFTSDTTVDDVINAVKEEREISFSFSADGDEKLAFIRHVPVEDTNVCILVSANYIKTMTSGVREGAVSLIMSIGVLFLLLILYVIYKEQKSINTLSSSYNTTNNLINSIPGGFILCNKDNDGKFIFTSSGFSELTGYNDKNVVHAYKNSIWNTISEEDRSRVKKYILDRVESDGNFEAIYKMSVKDGGLIYVLNRGGILHDEDGSVLMSCTVMDITEMENASRELRISEERYSVAISQSNIYVVEYDVAEDIVYISERATSRFGIPPTIKNFSKTNGWAPAFFKMVSEISKKSPHCEKEFPYTAPTGELFYTKNHITGIYSTDGQLIKVIGVVDDITHQKTVEINYKRALKFRDTLIKLYEIHCEFDITHNIIIANSASPDTVGSKYDEHECEFKAKKIHPDDAEKYLSVSTENGIKTLLEHGISEMDIQYRKRDTEDSPYRWTLAHITIFMNPADESVRTMWFIRDINDSVEEETALTDKALRDTLTGLYNKTTTETLISQALLSSTECGEEKIDALMIIDLDNFKLANDSMGHVFGDALLSEAAKKLTAIFRSSDIVGRIGGDEFMVLVKDISSADMAAKKAAELCRSIEAIHKNSVSNFSISASVGIALSRNGDMTFGEMYRKADTALYKSKDKGKNTFSIYNDSMGDMADREQTRPDAAKTPKLIRDSFAENQLRYIFTLLYTSGNTIDAIKCAMELLVSHFNLSRAYVFKLRDDNSGYDELFEMCGDNVSYNTEMLANGISIADRPDYEENFDDSSCFMANTGELEEPLRSCFVKQDIVFVLQIAIMKDCKFKGFLGYDVCGKNTKLTQKDISTLKNAGKMLAWFTLMQFEKMKWGDQDRA